MTTIFNDAPTYLGLTGGNARVIQIKDRVLIRAIDVSAEEGATIAMTPAQARALALGIIAAAEKAEAGE